MGKKLIERVSWKSIERVTGERTDLSFLWRALKNAVGKVRVQWEKYRGEKNNQSPNLTGVLSKTALSEPVLSNLRNAEKKHSGKCNYT